MSDEKRLRNESEAAEYLGLKKQTLANWRSTGSSELPFVKVGRLVRYRSADLDAWLESRTVRPMKQLDLPFRD